MNQPARTIAIGDIHGCSLALDALLEVVRPRTDDLVVTLGDYVDRGPDSRGVLERLIHLGDQCWLVPILGNHDDMFLQALKGIHPTTFLGMGGVATVLSYGTDAASGLDQVPRHHMAFLESCVESFETETHIFLHASYLPNRPMADQPYLALRWESLRNGLPEPHDSGKIAIVGHTSQKSGEILDAGHIKCIDTYCYGGGWLTALEVHAGTTWQVSREGRLRGPRR
jgi:serine/threonine protein phosphatase 1